MEKRNAVIYQFNPATGHIDSVISSSWEEGHEVFKRPNTIVASEYVPVLHTVVNSYGEEETFNNVLNSGWFIQVDDKGVPQTDAAGNLLISPPCHHVDDPDIHTYNFIANIKAGHLDPHEVHRDVITKVNHQLAKVGKPLIGKTNLLPHPVHTAVCRIVLKK